MKALIATRVASLVDHFPDEPVALYQGDRRTWSYVGALKELLDHDLADLDGAVPAAILLRQRPNCLAATIALWASGRCVTVLSPIRPDQAIVEDLLALRPAAVVADSEDWARPGFAEACADTIGIELRHDTTGPVAVLRTRPGSGVHPVPAAGDHAATITTSGTTGAPKRYGLDWDDLTPGGAVRDPGAGRGVVINALPLFSIGGVQAIATTIFGGRPIALMDRFDVQEWAALIREHKPRRAGAPPAVLRMLLDAEIPPEWLASVRLFYTASAPLPTHLAEEFEAVYGIPIVQGYGATEFLGAVTGWADDVHDTWGKAKRGSVGRALPGVRLRIVDRVTREPLGPNEIGNLEVQTPRRARGVPEGWVSTNDLARIDEDEFLWIHGRSDDVIIRGGFKVSLAEVEAALLEHPRVRDVCVVGLPDERLGEVPAALVVTDGDADPPAGSEFIDAVRLKLAPYMAPSVVLIQDAMPLNAMLKKDRVMITGLLAEARSAGGRRP
jgi:acyl-coenzyme A synthetase/AMP-(fatty) acid ligase